MTASVVNHGVSFIILFSLDGIRAAETRLFGPTKTANSNPKSIYASFPSLEVELKGWLVSDTELD